MVDSMAASDQLTVFDAIGEAATAATADVYAHAVDVDSGRDVSLRGDEPVVSGSVFKVPVLTEYVREVAAGRLDPATRTSIPLAPHPPGRPDSACSSTMPSGRCGMSRPR